MNYCLRSATKTEKQKDLEKMKQKLKKSIEEEDKLNAHRKTLSNFLFTNYLENKISFQAEEKNYFTSYNF